MGYASGCASSPLPYWKILASRARPVMSVPPGAVRRRLQVRLDELGADLLLVTRRRSDGRIDDRERLFRQALFRARLGLARPEDRAVVGVDDDARLAAHFHEARDDAHLLRREPVGFLGREVLALRGGDQSSLVARDARALELGDVLRGRLDRHRHRLESAEGLLAGHAGELADESEGLLGRLLVVLIAFVIIVIIVISLRRGGFLLVLGALGLFVLLGLLGLLLVLGALGLLLFVLVFLL